MDRAKSILPQFLLSSAGERRGKKPLFLLVFHHLHFQSLMSGFLLSPGSLMSAANKDKLVSPKHIQTANVFHSLPFLIGIPEWIQLERNLKLM